MRRFRIILASLVAVMVITSTAHAYQEFNLYSYKGSSHCGTIADPFTVIFYGSYAKTRLLAGDYRETRYPNHQGQTSVISGDFFQRTGWTRHSTDNLFRQDGYFFNHSTGYANGDCQTNPSDTDLASETGYGHGRWHTRMWDIGGAGTPGVATTPHREDWYWSEPGEKCASQSYRGVPAGSHAVERGAVDRGARYYEKHGSGFDRARRYVVNAFKEHWPGTTDHAVRYSMVGNTRSVKQCDGEYAGSNGQIGFVKLGH